MRKDASREIQRVTGKLGVRGEHSIRYGTYLHGIA